MRSVGGEKLLLMLLELLLAPVEAIGHTFLSVIFNQLTIYCMFYLFLLTIGFQLPKK